MIKCPNSVLLSKITKLFNLIFGPEAWNHGLTHSIHKNVSLFVTFFSEYSPFPEWRTLGNVSKPRGLRIIVIKFWYFSKAMGNMLLLRT